VIRRDPYSVPYPRIERNSRDQPIWNIGPYGYLAVVVSMIRLPDRWPAHWPDTDIITPGEIP
jgi:hypothetical protein